MDSVFALIFAIVMIIILVGLLAIPSIITFFLYKSLRKKGKLYGKIGLTILIFTTVAVIYFVVTMPSRVFAPEYETVEIKQDVGGKLICESVYNADHHSWQYNVDYKYINSIGDTIDFNSGGYYGREWDKNEQIRKFNNWLILKTGAWYGSDRLIIKNILTDSTRIYDINDDFIEKDSLWKKQKINSLLNYRGAETFVENIKDNKVLLTYKFRTDKNIKDKYGERKIIYEIENETGRMKMTQIK